jgi:hypothetical protein
VLVDPRAPAGPINGRLDFRISGRIDAAAPIERIDQHGDARRRRRSRKIGQGGAGAFAPLGGGARCGRVR